MCQRGRTCERQSSRICPEQQSAPAGRPEPPGSLASSLEMCVMSSCPPSNVTVLQVSAISSSTRVETTRASPEGGIILSLCSRKLQRSCKCPALAGNLSPEDGSV